MATPTDRKVVLITGCSSGLGKSAAELFAEKGWDVVATMRKPNCDAGVQLSSNPRILVLALDVTQEASITIAVEKTVETYSRLDVLINNAGYGLAGPVELATSEELVRQYNTNLLGPIQLMQKVLPTMRAQSSGTIINVTSIGGRLCLPLNALYHGTKFGLEGVSEAMALEVAPFGVRVRLVEPGGIKTDFGGRSLVLTKSETVEAYDPLVSNVLVAFGKRMGGGSTPEVIAEVLYEAATYEGHKIRFLAGEDAKEMYARRQTLNDEEYQNIMTEQFNVSLTLNEP